MLTKRTVKIPLWGTKLTIIVGDTIAEAMKAAPGMRQDFSELTDADLIRTVVGSSWRPASGFVQYIALPASAGLDVAVHEALHATWNVLEDRGVEDEEAYAYTLQWVFRQIVNVIDIHTKRSAA